MLGIFQDKFNFFSEEVMASPRAAIDEAYSAKVYIEGSNVVSRDDKGDIIAWGVAGKDDVAVIKETIDALPGGAIVLEGTFIITNAIDNLKSNIFINGTPGKTIFDCTNLVNRAFVIGEDNYGRTTTYLTEDASIGDLTIAVTDSSGYNENDYIKLIDDEEIMQFKKGQIFKIKEKRDNNLVLDKNIHR